MIDKQELAQEIGNFFGTYFLQDGQFCIDNYDTVYRYDSVDALLTDWVNSLVEHQNDNPDLSGYWEAEIDFIYSQVIGKYPEGVRPVENKTKDKTWKASIDVKDPSNPHGKNLHLGTYASIVDAVIARKVFAARMELEPFRTLEFWTDEAKKVQAQAKESKTESKTVVQNLISAIIEYGSESCWTDQDVFDTLKSCGLSYDDFQQAGYKSFARKYFQEEYSFGPSRTYVAETNIKNSPKEVLAQDPYLYACLADKGYLFLVRAVNEKDAENTGLKWYQENVFEPGRFSCWKAEISDLEFPDRSEILESDLYLSMVKTAATQKMSLIQQIQNAEDRSSSASDSQKHKNDVQR